MDGPHKTARCPSCVDRGGAPYDPERCGSAARTLVAPGHTRYPDRAPPRRWRPFVPPLPRLDTPTRGVGTQLCGGALLLQLTPQSRTFVATEPVDFRKGIDGLAAVCRQVLGDNPLEGAVYVFRNRAGTALTLWLYDGQGDWLCLKRFSQGRFTWWPKTADTRVPLSARELIIVLWNGNPERAHMAHDWRRVASGGASLA